MPHNPPPAPDWVMGDDGHWKPPPFVIGHDPAPGPSPHAAPPSAALPQAAPGAPGGAPLGLPPLAPRPQQSTGAVVAWVLGGLAVAFVALVGVCILAVTLLGTSAEQKFEAVGTGTPGDPSGGASGTGPFVPVDPDGPTGTDELVPEPVTEPEADPAVFCPSPAEVAHATGLPETETVGGGPMETQLDLNSVRASAVACEYGATVGVLAITGPERGMFLDQLRNTEGPFAVTAGSRDIPSLDVVAPAPDPSGGSVQVVFEVGTGVYSVARNGQDLASLEPLVDAVRARVE